MGEMETVKEKRAMAGFIVSLIAGIIIIVVALYMFAMMSWIASAFVGSYGVDFSGFFGAAAIMFVAGGLICGLLVIVGAVLIYRQKNVIGGVLVLVFSLLSIIAGGGLWVGLILGIVGGILGILKK